MDTNTDLLNRLLIISDQAIANLRACPKTKHIKMNPKLLNLFESKQSKKRKEESENSVDTSEDSLDEHVITSYNN